MVVIPNYKEENLEFKNGKCNARFENIGDFQPMSGTWTVESVCEEIAEKLLKVLHDKYRSSKGPLDTLRAKLVFSEFDDSEFDDSDRSDLHGIYIDEKALRDHPFEDPKVVEYFIEMTGGRLPVYIYKIKNLGDDENNLKVDEEDLRRILLEDFVMMKEFSTDNLKEDISQREPVEKSGNNFSNISNSTIICAGRDHVGSIKVDQKIIEQLHREMDLCEHQMKNTISYNQYEDIKSIFATILQEVNNNKTDKSILINAKEHLDNYKDKLSAVGNFASIISLLSMIIGS